MSGPKDKTGSLDAKTKALADDAKVQEWHKFCLKNLHQQYEAGANLALMEAIKICADNALPLPDWAARAFSAAYDKVRNCHSNSWDDVFGQPYPGKHLDKLRQRRELRFAVYLRVEKLRQDSRIPLNDTAWTAGAFAIVADEYGIKRTLCSELYYEVKTTLRELDQEVKDELSAAKS